MAPQGRGHRPRGRGAIRGRGRSARGRGSSRFGPTRKFESDRLADRSDSDSSDEDSVDANSETKDESLGLESEEEEIENACTQPYLTLLQSLTSASAPKAKKRKLEHQGSLNEANDEPQREEQADDKESVDVVDPADEKDPSACENEEAPGSEIDSDDDEGNDAATDDFVAHFERPYEDSTSRAIQAVGEASWTTTRTTAQSLRAVLSSPGSGSSFELPPPQHDLQAFQLKQKLKESAASKIGKLSESQALLMPMLSSYRDVLYCNRTVANSERLRQIVCLHALNHIFKTRDRVIKNSYKLAKAGEEAYLELRDQGFTRPKILFLLPTRNSCARMVNVIRDFCNPEQQENRKRFDDSYIDKVAKVADTRPEDFKDLFEGNYDDMFRIGVKFTRKTIKYFAQFYSSDILFASPLGLRMAMGSDQDKKKPDHDFLSSIEIVIIDQADALLVQNWEHVEYIFEHLNLQPKDAHGCDFSRVRNWYLEDWAKFFRQTIVLSSFNTPELAELQRLHCHNWAGKVRLQPEYQGVIQQLRIRAKQTFSRLEAPSLDRDAESRFEYFQSTVLRALVKRPKDATGTLLFIPSYLDFVSIRNFFATSPTVSNLAFGAISEYTAVPEASRARSYFLTGRYHVLLYTERAHHFRRYRFRGVRKVVFYGLPDNPTFYKEVAGESLAKSEQDLKIEPGQGLVRALFSRYDAMKLERVVGTTRVGKILHERGDMFEFT